MRGQIREGRDGSGDGADLNRRQDCGAGLSVWTVAACGRAGKGGLSGTLPRAAARWWPPRDPGPPEQGHNAPTVTPPQLAPGAGMMRRPTACPATGQSCGRKGPRGRDPFAGPTEWFRHQPGPDYNAPARANVTTRARGGMASPLPGAHSRWFVPAAGAGHLPRGARFLLSMNQCSFVVPP